MSDEKTSQRVATIAAKAMQNPKSLTSEEIQALAASALNQAPNQGQGQQKNQAQPQYQSGQQSSQQKK
jgi:hypothetical protein